MKIKAAEIANDPAINRVRKALRIAKVGRNEVKVAWRTCKWVEIKTWKIKAILITFVNRFKNSKYPNFFAKIQIAGRLI